MPSRFVLSDNSLHSFYRFTIQPIVRVRENIMMKEDGKKRKRKGFMLLELIIVVAIIGILAAVAMPNLVGFTDEAKVARIQSDLSAIGTAAEVYYTKKGTYPESTAVLVSENLLKSEPQPPDKVTYTINKTSGEVTATFKDVTYSSFGKKDGTTSGGTAATGS